MQIEVQYKEVKPVDCVTIKLALEEVEKLQSVLGMICGEGDRGFLSQLWSSLYSVTQKIEPDFSSKLCGEIEVKK